jgi:hypothetical protein
MKFKALAAPLAALLLGLVPVADGQETTREKWRKVDGYWRFATIDDSNRPMDQGFLLINADGLTSPGIWSADGARNNYIEGLAIEGQEYVIGVAWFWTRDEIRLRLAAPNELRGTWKSSFDGKIRGTTLTRVVPKLERITVERQPPSYAVLRVTGSDMPIPYGPYGIRGVAYVNDPEIKVSQAAMNGQTLEVRLVTGAGAKPGRKALVVNGASIEWTFGAAELQRASTVRITGAGAPFDTLASIPIGGSFRVEVSYPEEPGHAQVAVRIRSGQDAGRTFDAVARRTQDGRTYRTEPVRVVDPDDR